MTSRLPVCGLTRLLLCVQCLHAQGGRTLLVPPARSCEMRTDWMQSIQVFRACRPAFHLSQYTRLMFGEGKGGRRLTVEESALSQCLSKVVVCAIGVMWLLRFCTFSSFRAVLVTAHSRCFARFGHHRHATRVKHRIPSETLMGKFRGKVSAVAGPPSHPLRTLFCVRYRHRLVSRILVCGSGYVVVDAGPEHLKGLTCGPEAPDDSVFDGNAIFSVTCRDGGSFPRVSTCSKPAIFLSLRL